MYFLQQVLSIFSNTLKVYIDRREAGKASYAAKVLYKPEETEEKKQLAQDLNFEFKEFIAATKEEIDQKFKNLKREDAPSCDDLEYIHISVILDEKIRTIRDINKRYNSGDGKLLPLLIIFNKVWKKAIHTSYIGSLEELDMKDEAHNIRFALACYFLRIKIGEYLPTLMEFFPDTEEEKDKFILTKKIFIGDDMQQEIEDIIIYAFNQLKDAGSSAVGLRQVLKLAIEDEQNLNLPYSGSIKEHMSKYIKILESTLEYKKFVIEQKRKIAKSKRDAQIRLCKLNANKEHFVYHKGDKHEQGTTPILKHKI